MSFDPTEISLFSKPKLKVYSPLDYRILLYGDQATLRVKICALGVLDQFMELKREISLELEFVVSDKIAIDSIKEVIGKIKPLRQFLDSSKQQAQAHLSAMIESINKAKETLPEKTAAISFLVMQLLDAYRACQKELEGDNSFSSVKQYANSFMGLSTGYRYLPKEVMDKIIPLGKNDAMLKTIETGSRPVALYDGLFWKVKPTGPLYELAFHLLGKIALNISSAPSEFVRFERKLSQKDKTYYTQASLGMDGLGMHKVLRECPDWIRKLDPLLYGHTVILHFLGLPQDAKPDNFIAMPIKNAEGEIQNVVWKGIDEDECFAHPVCKVPKSNHIINCRSFFFNLPQIYQTVHPLIRKHFERMNPAVVVLDWLFELYEANQKVIEMARSGGIPLSKLKKMHMPLYLLSDVVPKLYAKLVCIKNYLQVQAEEVTYMDVFKKAVPELAYYYDLINQSFPNDPGAAFNRIFIGGGPLYEEIMKPMMNFPVVGKLPLSESLKQWNHSLVDYLNMRDTLPEKAAEGLLQNFNFQIFTEDEQKQILQKVKQFPLAELTFRCCSELTDSEVRDIVRNKPHLKKMTFINCPNITDAALDVLIIYHRSIDISVIECSGISQEKMNSLKDYFPGLVGRDRRQTLYTPETSLKKQSENEKTMLELSAAIQKGLWPDVMCLIKSFKESGLVLQSTIQIIQKLLTTSLMNDIVKKNQLDVLEFLFSLKIEWSQRNPEGQTFFHICCEEGNAEMLLWLCQKEIEWKEIVDKREWTPFHTCVEKDKQDCLKILINFAKSVLDQTDKSGTTPLRLAFENKNIESAKLLITAGARLDEKTNQNKNLMHTLCATGLEAFLEIFTAQLPDLVNQADKAGRTPLFSAIEFNQIHMFDKVQPLMKSINTPDNNAITLLMFAAQLNRSEMVASLIKANADRSALDSDGMSAAHIAALAGSFESLLLLLGENPTPATWKVLRKDKKTYLHLAAISGNAKCVQWLCDKGHPILEKDEKEFIPALYAAQGGHWEAFSIFLKYRMPIDFNDNPAKETPLMLTLRGRHFTMADKMKEAGANLLAVNNRGFNALHQAAKEGDCEVIHFLSIEKKIEVNILASNSRKVTPLHLASASGHLNAVDKLLNLGGSPNSKDIDGKTPLHLAMQTGHEAVARKLVSRGADVNAVMKDGWSCLHYAANFTHSKLIELLLSCNPQLIGYKTNEEGHTALHRAMYQEDLTTLSSNQSKEQVEQKRLRQIEVIKVLLRYGIEVDERDKFNYTALHLAAKNGRLDFADLLLSRGARADIRNDNGRTPAEHGIYMAEKAGNEQKKNAILAVSKRIQDAGTISSKQKIPHAASDRSLVKYLQQPFEDKTKLVLENIKEDQGFRRESILRLRAIEMQLPSFDIGIKLSFESKLKEMVRGWDQNLVNCFDQQNFQINLDVPNLQQQILECISGRQSVLKLDQIIYLIPFLGFTTHILQHFINTLEGNRQIAELALPSICNFLLLIKGHEAYHAIDFPPNLCQKLTKSLEKYKKENTKETISAVKEFLNNPSHVFLKYRSDVHWKQHSLQERKAKLLSDLSRMLEKGKVEERESFIDQLAVSVWKMNIEWLSQIQFKDYIPYIDPGRVSNNLNSPLSILEQTAANLTSNALIFLLQDSDAKKVSGRFEFMIEWMHKSVLFGDFHQAYALFKAMSHPALSRLHKTRKKLSLDILQKLTQAETLFLPSSQYQSYFVPLRNRLSPSIPAFAIFLQLFSKESSYSIKYQCLKQIQAYRSFVRRLILPPQIPSEGQLFLTESLFINEWNLKNEKENKLPGETFAWNQSRKIEVPK